MKKIYLSLFISVLILGCQKKKEVLISEQLKEKLKNAANNGRDTILSDLDGMDLHIQINAKVVDIEHSINGKVKYSYNTDGDEFVYDRFGNIAKTVFKENYRNDTLKIKINDDSLFVGEVFNGSIWIDEKNYKVRISEPVNELASSDTFNSYAINFNCLEEGLYRFKGEILFDSLPPFPFEYKFIVVQKYEP